MYKAIRIYSSCNWVRFFKPNDKDSNWLSSRSLLNIQAESEENKIGECFNRLVKWCDALRVVHMGM